MVFGKGLSKIDCDSLKNWEIGENKTKSLLVGESDLKKGVNTIWINWFYLNKDNIVHTLYFIGEGDAVSKRRVTFRIAKALTVKNKKKTKQNKKQKTKKKKTP